MSAAPASARSDQRTNRRPGPTRRKGVRRVICNSLLDYGPARQPANCNLRFNNPNNEAFTVTLNIVGNLARISSSSSASQTGASTYQTTTRRSSGLPASDLPAGTITNLVFRVTCNPLLNSVTIQVVSP
jgi:hypothetical protein